MQKYIDACVEQNQTTNTHLFGDFAIKHIYTV